MARFYLFATLLIFNFALTTLHAQCPPIDAGDDLYLCFPPGPANLNGSIDGPYIDFEWTPTNGLIGTNTLTPTVITTQNMTYYLKVRGVDLSNNLILNGDFEGGNFGFWSDYVYSPGDLWPEGVYDVLPNPQAAHANFSPCPDHTSGSGNMMAVNGAGTPGLNVWCQTVPVTPNTEYAFSAWVTTLVSSSPALLQFSINGDIIGPIFNAPSTTCTWLNFYTTWNSGGNTTATICIVNQNTVLGGNDFALDDIVFSPICEVIDSVKVNIVNIKAVAAPAISMIPCEGAEITLNGTGSSVGPDIYYQWETPNGNIVSGETTLNPVVNAAGTYTLTVTYNNGFVECTKTATVSVIENPNPLFAWIVPPTPLGCEDSTTLIIGNSSQPAFSSYSWTAGPGGNIISNPDSKNITVDQPGEYTLLVTNTTTGCTAEETVLVTEATDPPIAVAMVEDTISCTLTTVTLFGDSSSTGNDIIYAWDTIGYGNIISGQDSLQAVVGSGGTYLLTVTNTTNGCIATDTVVVQADTLAPLVSIDPAGTFNCTLDTLTLNGMISPANPSPAWIAFNGGIIASGDSTLHPNVIAAGSYVLSAANPANGCIATDTIQVGIDTIPPLAIALPADTITCQQPSISLSGQGSSSGPNFTYQWVASAGGNIVSGANTLNPTVNAAGAYTLLVTDTVNTCFADSAVVVVTDNNALTAIANAPDTLTCADTLVLLNSNGSSNLPGILYAWTTSNGVIVSGADTPEPTVGAPGTYQLLLTNPANGCTATDDATVAQDITPPSITIDPPDTLTCANPSQTLQGQNNSAGSFQYQWTAGNGGNILSGENTLTPLINAAGTYTLETVNLENGCSSQVSMDVAIEAGTPVAVTADPGPITCFDPTQTINTAGSSMGPNFTYAWTASGGGNFVSGQNTPSPVVDAPGTYALTITNTANGCTATATVVVMEDTQAPPADAGPDGLLTCTDPVFTLTANNGIADPILEYLWQTANGNIIGSPDSLTIQTAQAGTYNLTVSNTQNGCTSTATATIIANQVPPAISIDVPLQLTCIQNNVTLNINGAGPNFTYQWSTANGQFVSGQASPAPVVNAPGTYELLVTDTVNGCTSTETVVVVQDIVIPQAGIAPPPLLTCALTEIALQGDIEPGPGIDVTWSAGNGGNIISGANTPNPLVDQPGDYQMVVTNTANGCTNTASITVLQDIVAPTANAGPDATLSCLIPDLKLLGTGSANGTPSYNWTAISGGNILSGANTLNPTIDAPGQYILLVTDLDNGCTATDTVNVLKDNNAPLAAVATPGTLTCVVTQLSLQGNGSLGASFSHQWTASNGGNIVSGANTLAPVVNAPGTYILTVTNLNNGCTTTASGIVNQNLTPPALAIAAPDTLTCLVQSFSLSGTPAGPGFNYFWTTTGGFIVSGGNSATPVVNMPGSYTAVVTSQTNGCTSSGTVQVTSDTNPPVVAAAPPPVLTCAMPQVDLIGSVSQPASGFTASWTTANGQIVSGQNTLTAQISAPGDYVLTVQNTQNGCTASTTALATQNILPPAAVAGAGPTITCAAPQAALDGSASSGQGALTFSWSGGQILSGANTPAPVVNEATTYTLVVTDAANGCTASDTVTVLEDVLPPDALILAPQVRTCARDTVILDASGSSSGPGYTINWTTANGLILSGQTGLMPQVGAAGEYVLNIVNQQNGCSATATVSVEEDLTPPQAEAGPPADLHCNNPAATLQGSSSTMAALAFSWSAGAGGNIVSGSTTPAPVVDAPGNYQLTVTNIDNGCSATDIVLVTATPPPAFTPESIQPDCHWAKGTIDFGPVSGGVPPFQYSLDGGQSFQAGASFSNLTPGTYDLVVLDNYGCTAQAVAEINEPFFPTVELTLPDILDQGDSVLLEPVLNLPASAVVVWEWTPANGLSCTDCPNPWARPLQATTYHLTIEDQNGCIAEANVLVRVNRRRNLYAPNIFSPNGDGENDRFLIYGKGVAEIQTLRIFDRWGNQLFLNEHFQPNEESQGWDGRYRGQDMNPGVFVWQAVIEFVDGAVEVYAGDVTLYR